MDHGAKGILEVSSSAAANWLGSDVGQRHRYWPPGEAVYHGEAVAVVFHLRQDDNVQVESKWSGSWPVRSVKLRPFRKCLQNFTAAKAANNSRS